MQVLSRDRKVPFKTLKFRVVNNYVIYAKDDLLKVG